VPADEIGISSDLRQKTENYWVPDNTNLLYNPALRRRGERRRINVIGNTLFGWKFGYKTSASTAKRAAEIVYTNVKVDGNKDDTLQLGMYPRVLTGSISFFPWIIFNSWLEKNRHFRKPAAPGLKRHIYTRLTPVISTKDYEKIRSKSGYRRKKKFRCKRAEVSETRCG
jgi:hypothetical protein